MAKSIRVRTGSVRAAITLAGKRLAAVPRVLPDFAAALAHGPVYSGTLPRYAGRISRTNSLVYAANTCAAIIKTAKSAGA